MKFSSFVQKTAVVTRIGPKRFEANALGREPKADRATISVPPRRGLRQIIHCLKCPWERG